VFPSLREDFDGSSTHELLPSLDEQCDGVNEVFVDMDGLNGHYFKHQSTHGAP
jgi:hypothetical protein